MTNNEFNFYFAPTAIDTFKVKEAHVLRPTSFDLFI